MMVLTDDQQECLKVVKDGHSFVILGQAGTGKSVLVSEIFNQLSGTGKHVQITATTGIAASQFPSGRTLHSWVGILDGRFSNREAAERVSNDENTAQRIRKTNTLIIDEISMLSAKLFDQGLSSLRFFGSLLEEHRTTSSSDFNF
ncbi:ATP-dependent DNA helicase PIF1-like [Pecten maximus]|uniref:ATP-dependent DNA helicase PIF1-like n=1 Tax=Pecten maximus TaxID=6579 RepID=UPI0014588158|nr:ATP-dependent DNA helicase PIF1-like [Pecten maximus]